MEITSITTVFSDGSIVTTSGPFTPVTAPTVAEIQDVVVEKTDGTSETFNEGTGSDTSGTPTTDTPAA